MHNGKIGPLLDQHSLSTFELIALGNIIVQYSLGLNPISLLLRLKAQLIQPLLLFELEVAV